MTYTLITVVDDNDNPVEYRLENPHGEIIHTYDEKPSHPAGTAEEVLSDVENVEAAILYHLQGDWSFKTV